MDPVERERIAALMKQVSQLERKVDFLLKHLSLELPEEDADSAVRPQIEALLKQGKQLDAIKLFQLETGLGLKASKEAVEKIERDLKSSS